MAISREDVSFQTVDGLTLRGWLYTAAYGPAIIITPGVGSKFPQIDVTIIQTDDITSCPA